VLTGAAEETLWKISLRVNLFSLYTLCPFVKDIRQIRFLQDCDSRNNFWTATVSFWALFLRGKRQLKTMSARRRRKDDDDDDDDSALTEGWGNDDRRQATTPTTTTTTGANISNNSIEHNKKGNNCNEHIRVMEARFCLPTEALQEQCLWRGTHHILSIVHWYCTCYWTMHIPWGFSTLRSGVCFKTHTRTSIVTWRRSTLRWFLL